MSAKDAPLPFHPAIQRWFATTLGSPTPPQVRGWAAIQSGQHTLIAAPTGSGKTLAAFLAAIDELVREGVQGAPVGGQQRFPACGLEDATRVLYVSPLKALSNDIRKNLEEPLAGIEAELEAAGEASVNIRVMVRTGDTPSRERVAMVRCPPQILVTTPESLYLLLTSKGGRGMLKTVRTVIVDEIHAMVGDKRGSHLALSLERLEALTSAPLLRIGLSATQRPITEVARFLVGCAGLNAQGVPQCAIVDTGHTRHMELTLKVPSSPLEAVMAGEVWEEVFDRVAAQILNTRTTLIFVNTRRMAERVTARLAERLEAGQVGSHHGSMAKEHRLDAEQRLKTGSLRALVATASLELGIDIGAVELVVQLGSPRSIAAFLQRVGRSGHGVGRLPRGWLFPLSRDDLVECAALLDACRRGELDLLRIPEAPLDILAQQIVAAVAAEDWEEAGLYALMRRAYPYRGLSQERFAQVVGLLAEGFATARGRRGAYLHRDVVHGRLRARKGARLTALTCGGAIPDNADYEVVEAPENLRVGSVHEDFAIESTAGDIFQLGNTSWRILRVEPGTLRVQNARGQPPTIPFWLGEAPGRSVELSHAVSRLREEVALRLGTEKDAQHGQPPHTAQAAAWLEQELKLPPEAALQLAEYLAAAWALLGAMPSQQTVVLERFFDESGGMQLVIHSPFGSRLNRAWGLALRKRFCRKFNFELQAAANDDAIVLSLGVTHSFALEEVFGYLHSATVRPLLVQALLDAPMFITRWRWNATRALAVPRWRGGKKVAPQLQRMQAEDLIAIAFPDQIACAENLAGEREIPDHPLVFQTIRDCLEDAMSIDALEALLRAMEQGQKTMLARDVPEPSPLAHEILNAKPYAFLDDAPLEERRTQAVIARRWINPATAAELGRLDAEAIREVQRQAWPQAETVEELHDALLLLGFITSAEGATGAAPSEGHSAQAGTMPWRTGLESLLAQGRATLLHSQRKAPLWVAAERLAELLALFPGATCTPVITPVPLPGPMPGPMPGPRQKDVSAEEALVSVLRSRLEGLGPVTVAALGNSLGLPPTQIETALFTLEGEGFALRGRYTLGEEETWCERRLLARIHRYTLNRLRAEVDPVSAQDYLRFLVHWQHAGGKNRPTGPAGLAAILQQLEGFTAAAASWEKSILPTRLASYDPAWLDALCLSGRYLWLRLSPPGGAGRGRRRRASLRNTPIALLSRKALGHWKPQENRGAGVLSFSAVVLRDWLGQQGASFSTDIGESLGMLPMEVEQTLAELAALGQVTADSYAGLRALLKPASSKRRPLGRGRNAGMGLESAGRWALLGPPRSVAEDSAAGQPAETETGCTEIARTLLSRYGVVFRRVLEREQNLPPWWALLRALRTMEARGEVRGGRFVAGFSGEQYALPDAVEALRNLRKRPFEKEHTVISAADPLNLAGILTPAPRLPAVAGHRLLLRDGLPVASWEKGHVRPLVSLSPQDHREAEHALLQRTAPLPFYRDHTG